MCHPVQMLDIQVGAREGRGEATASARDEEEGTGKSKLNHYGIMDGPFNRRMSKYVVFLRLVLRSVSKRKITF